MSKLEGLNKILNILEATQTFKDIARCVKVNIIFVDVYYALGK